MYAEREEKARGGSADRQREKSQTGIRNEETGRRGSMETRGRRGTRRAKGESASVEALKKGRKKIHLLATHADLFILSPSRSFSLSLSLSLFLLPPSIDNRSKGTAIEKGTVGNFFEKQEDPFEQLVQMAEKE